MSVSTRQLIPGIVIAAALLLILGAACAPLPFTFSYQGRLLNSAGNPVPDGNYAVRYNLFTSSSGGTPVFTDTETISVQDGLFNSAIGSDVEIPADLFAQPTYLQITINNQTLSPRQPLRGAPYAFSLASGAVVQGTEPITRTFSTYQNTGSVLTILNTDSSPKGGHSLFLVNQAAPVTADKSKVAAVQARAGGTSYAGIFSSEAYRGTYHKGSSNFAAAVFDSSYGISLLGGGQCYGCTLAYPSLNVGDEAIEAGQFVAAAGVSVDEELNQPIMLVRKARSAEDAIIGVASGALDRTTGEEYYGVDAAAGFDGREGAAGPGEYVAVVVQGLVRARVSQGAGVEIGSDLTLAADGVLTATDPTQSVARALSALDETGMVWVMFNGR